MVECKNCYQESGELIKVSQGDNNNSYGITAKKYEHRRCKCGKEKRVIVW